ncbi:MAG: hypothetical protein KHW93_11700, partial [Butyricicoccus pullicaecorum]|nr:hypothetical protein [Butyricicoccus pullicaecorum]
DFHLRHEHGDVLCVDLADAARADNTNFHGLPPVSLSLFFAGFYPLSMVSLYLCVRKTALAHS